MSANGKIISLTIYSELELSLPAIKPVEPSKATLRLGYTCITHDTILKMLAEVKEHYKDVADAVVKMHEHYGKKYGSSYCFLVLPRENQAAVKSRIKELRDVEREPQ